MDDGDGDDEQRNKPAMGLQCCKVATPGSPSSESGRRVGFLQIGARLRDGSRCCVLIDQLCEGAVPSSLSPAAWGTSISLAGPWHPYEAPSSAG